MSFRSSSTDPIAGPVGMTSPCIHPGTDEAYWDGELALIVAPLTGEEDEASTMAHVRGGKKRSKLKPVDEDDTKRAKIKCTSTAQLACWLKVPSDRGEAAPAFAPLLPSPPASSSAGSQQHGDIFDALYSIMDGSSVQAVAYNVPEPALPLPPQTQDHEAAVTALVPIKKAKKVKKSGIGTLKRKDEPCLDVCVRGS